MAYFCSKIVKKCKEANNIDIIMINIMINIRSILIFALVIKIKKC